MSSISSPNRLDVLADASANLQKKRVHNQIDVQSSNVAAPIIKRRVRFTSDTKMTSRNSLLAAANVVPQSLLSAQKPQITVYQPADYPIYFKVFAALKGNCSISEKVDRIVSATGDQPHLQALHLVNMGPVVKEEVNVMQIHFRWTVKFNEENILCRYSASIQQIVEEAFGLEPSDVSDLYIDNFNSSKVTVTFGESELPDIENATSYTLDPSRGEVPRFFRRAIESNLNGLKR